jgi:hypothetical protein
MSEGERLIALERKIANTDYKSKELQKEIKMLKRLAHDKGNELVDLDISKEYPEKIRSLLEEIRWSKEKQNDL